MKTYSKDEGVAGLTVLLSIVVSLFVIGFIVMIFSIMGGQVEQAVWTDVTGTVVNETLTTVTEAGEYTQAGIDYWECSLSGVLVSNETNSGGVDTTVIPESNYSLIGCQVVFVGESANYFNNTNWNITYTYSAKSNNTASLTMEDVSDELSEVTDWFGIIIVLGAMVVLILLTVIIISAIKGTGFVAMGKGGNNASA